MISVAIALLVEYTVHLSEHHLINRRNNVRDSGHCTLAFCHQAHRNGLACWYRNRLAWALFSATNAFLAAMYQKDTVQDEKQNFNEYTSMKVLGSDTPSIACHTPCANTTEPYTHSVMEN